MNNADPFVNGLLANNNYLIVAHENPDADSIGSMLAIYQILKKLGKKAWMMSGDPVPNFSWPNIDLILPVQDVPYDNVIILDCGPERTGSLEEYVKRAKLTFNIDHHQGNNGVCDYNLIDFDQAATCMIIYNLVNLLELELEFAIAQPLYGGIVGDTGGFRHANSTESVFLAAANLVKHGAMPDQTGREIFGNKSFDFLQFLGFALSKIQTTRNNQLVWLALSYDDFLRYNMSPQNSDQLIEYARMVAGSEIVILFREVAPNHVRVGFRSNRIDIHQIATKFGGGGHILAAGATIEDELASSVEKVINVALELLEGEIDGRNNKHN